MLGLVAAVGAVAVPIASAFYVRVAVHETDKAAQAAVNATVDKNVTVITVKIDALKQTVEDGQKRTEASIDALTKSMRGR